MTSSCWICRAGVSDSEIRTIRLHDSTLSVHASCLHEFAAVARTALEGSPTIKLVSGLDRLARKVQDRIVLVHRRFPNEQIPLLVYLAHFDEPVPVPEVYTWLRQNELGIDNPSLALLRLTRKGLVTTFKDGDARRALITDDGRHAVDEYAQSLAEDGVVSDADG